MQKRVEAHRHLRIALSLCDPLHVILPHPFIDVHDHLPFLLQTVRLNFPGIRHEDKCFLKHPANQFHGFPKLLHRILGIFQFHILRSRDVFNDTPAQIRNPVNFALNQKDTCRHGCLILCDGTERKNSGQIFVDLF